MTKFDPLEVLKKKQVIASYGRTSLYILRDIPKSLKIGVVPV